MDDEQKLLAVNLASIYRLAWEIVRREKGDAATMGDVTALINKMKVV